VSLWDDLPSPKATAKQEVPCTRTYGINVKKYYQKYEPKASGGDERISGLESQMREVQEWKKQVQGRFKV